jgi:CRISPR-associated protein Cas1
VKQHLNTLFVTTPGAYLAKDGQSVAVRMDRQVRIRVPLHNLGSVVCFGAVGCSPAVMAACAKAGIAFTLLSARGRLLARVTGFTPGNVLLRREQYRRADEEAAAIMIARSIVLAKVANSRVVLLRAARDRPQSTACEVLRQAAHRLAQVFADAQHVGGLDRLRGLEGDASRAYFAAFNGMITNDHDAFVLHGRTRRPPRDNVNALLSFLYSILMHDARTACEAAGLDPGVGFLHTDRPGRPSLALDLMEEFRAFLADRVTLSLINRQQLRPSDFTCDEAGGVMLTGEARKTVLAEYQKRKQESIMHPFLEEKTTIGLLVHLQARLLARHLRDELDAYPAFIAR